MNLPYPQTEQLENPISYSQHTRENLLEFIFESSNDAIIGTDLNGRILEWNQAAEKIYGYKKDEILVKNISLLIPIERRTETVKIRERLLSGELVKNFETQRIRKDGKLICVSQTLSPIKNFKNQIIGFSTISHDVTSQKALENLKKEFLSSAAHELKTPITTLKLLSQFHLKKFIRAGKDSLTLEELELIDKELDRLTILVNDVLDDQRIETGKLLFRFETLDLTNLTKEVRKQLKPLFPTHKIIFLKKKLATEKVLADHDRLKQVLINLISNAVKYSPINSKIYIDLGKFKDSLVVSVKDEGIGIPKDKLEKIFDRFYQIKEGKGGFGLGLYLSREIIKSHRGKIWAENNAEKGSTFFFSLPILKTF